MAHDHGHTNTDMDQCIENCMKSTGFAWKPSLTACMGGVHAEPDHIRLMQDCVQICQTSADFLLRGSPFHVYTCRACAEVCEACADDCERLAKQDNDTHMQACADACRKCAATCREMSKMAA